MSAAQGQEVLEETALPIEPAPLPRPLRPVRPVRPVAAVPSAVRTPAAAPRSGPAAWVSALRLESLPVSLLGAAVGGLVVARTPGVRPLPLSLAVAALLIGHLLGGLVRSLGDARPDRAGPLRRVEAGRTLLGLTAVGLGLAVALTVLQGALALAFAAAGAVLVVGASSRRLSSAALGAVGALAGAFAAAFTVWGATGSLSGALLPALVAGSVTGPVLAARRDDVPSPRPLVVVPYAAVGLAVGVEALPWPALLVAAALPSARKAATAARRSAATELVAGHARLVGVLLVGGLVVSATAGL